jgi:hypothetical protein
MADDLTDRGAADRRRINLQEEWELNYWTKELNSTESEIREAIDEVGDQADSVRKYLSDSK